MEVIIPVSDTPSFASTREALGMLHAVMGYLSADAGEMAAAERRWRRKLGLPCGLIERTPK